MIKKSLILPFVAASLLAGGAVAEEITADTVVATINGTDITIGHMIVLRDGLPEQYRQLPDDVLYDGILEQLVQQTLLSQNYQGSDYAINLRTENEERRLRASQAIDVAISTSVSDEALSALYAERFADLDPDREFNASHILVDSLEEAEALVEQLGSGADFAELARENSTGPSGPNGGQLGWFGAGMMVKPFEEAVMAMEVGTVSEPVQTQFGWHVIRLNETRLQDAPTLEDVRDQLIEELQQEAVAATLEQLENAADIPMNELPDIDPSILSNTSLVKR